MPHSPFDESIQTGSIRDIVPDTASIFWTMLLNKSIQPLLATPHGDDLGPVKDELVGQRSPNAGGGTDEQDALVVEGRHCDEAFKISLLLEFEIFQVLLYKEMHLDPILDEDELPFQYSPLLVLHFDAPLRTRSIRTDIGATLDLKSAGSFGALHTPLRQANLFDQNQVARCHKSIKATEKTAELGEACTPKPLNPLAHFFAREREQRKEAAGG